MAGDRRLFSCCLFALYTLYQADVFSRAACISGSLWFPGFREYVFLSENERQSGTYLFFSGEQGEQDQESLSENRGRKYQSHRGIFPKERSRYNFSIKPREIIIIMLRKELLPVSSGFWKDNIDLMILKKF